MIAAMLALVGVLGIGGFVAYRMSLSSEPKDSATSTEFGKTPDAASAPTPAGTAKNASAATAPPATTTEPGKDQTPAPPTVETAKSGAGTTSGTPAKANAAASKAARPGNAPSAATSGPTEAPPAAPAAVARTPAATVASPQPDRWQQMHEAMVRCKREDFFRRIGCEQSVGLQYCEGYWGKVPQCPGAPRESGR
jgi:hypothetical protein